MAKWYGIDGKIVTIILHKGAEKGAGYLKGKTWRGTVGHAHQRNDK